MRQAAYFNINKSKQLSKSTGTRRAVWSLMTHEETQSGKPKRGTVTGYLQPLHPSEDFALSAPRLHVMESTAKRLARTKGRKEVYAWVSGVMLPAMPDSYRTLGRLTINHHSGKACFTLEGESGTSADLTHEIPAGHFVRFTNQGAFLCAI
jgi:hypothetical protein